jgi:hypothetical protein
MCCRRSSLRWSTLPAWLTAGVLLAISSTLAAAQDCPTASSGKAGFVVQRGELQKTEVFHADDGIVRAVTRYNGATVLELTEHQGLFELDRLDRNVKTKYEPQTDLKSLFPLKPGRTVKAEFTSDTNGRRGTLSVELAVKGTDVVWIGPCKYSVLKIDRTVSYSGRTPRFIDTDYYSPELRLSLAKEWRDGNGSGTHTHKYDRIYSLKPGRAAQGRQRTDRRAEHQN